MSPLPAIALEDVRVAYPGGVVALDCPELKIARGAFTVLLGPSGAGKSTLLRSFNGLVRPTRGRVVSAGLGDISKRGMLRHHRRETAMVFQQHQLIGRRSALANVLTGRLAFHSTFRTLLPLGHDERRLALQALERVGLLDMALRRADTLSGGQQQRVGIARALVQKPKLVLADEPVASLDPETGRKVLALLHEICRSDGITAVVSLHQVELARAFADRIVGISQGQVVFDGAASALNDRALDRIYSRPEDTSVPGSPRDAAPERQAALA